MHLNQGKFRQNGGCGYILKPKFMRDPDEKGINYLFGYLTTSYQLSLMLSHDTDFTPLMKEPHHAVTPVNLEITVSI